MSLVLKTTDEMVASEKPANHDLHFFPLCMEIHVNNLNPASIGRSAIPIGI